VTALGNAYPAIQLDPRGDQVDSGIVLQFTDADDQPGSSSGSQGVNASLRAQTGGTRNDAAAFIGRLTGDIYSEAVQWSLAGAMGQVADLDAIRYLLSGTVPSTPDAFDVTLAVAVTDAVGANQASCSGGFTVPNPVTNLSSANSLAGGTWSIDTGADLTAVGNILSSTAGGHFFVLVQVTGVWD
jgi:hypothetical protein